MPRRSPSAHASSDPSGSNTPAAQPSEPAVTPTYTHSFDDIEGVWQGDAVQILHTSGLVLATLPTDFLAGSGDNSWSFVYKILAMVAQCDDAPVMVYDAQGAAVPRATEGAPRAGAYELRHPDGSEVVIATGPQNKRGNARGAPNLDTRESTVSASSRSSTNQSQFRTRLFVRDGSCLVSERWHEECMACHIAPVSRPDVYRALCGSDRVGVMYATSSGLTLRSEEHRAFDNFKWSIYCADDGSYIIHVFTSDPREFHHGKRLDPSTRFRLRPFGRSDLPDPRLLKWHYKQCAMARIRGYAWNMAINAQNGTPFAR